MENQILQVTPKENFDTPVVEVSFEPELMLQKGPRQTLSEELAKACNGLKDNRKPGCVVIIKASTSGAPVIRALLELYKTVTANGGQLRLVDYLWEFRDSLGKLGFRSLPDFAHSASIDEAVKEILKQS